MPGFSVDNQYCDMNTGNWFQTVYMGSTDCLKPWWMFWFFDNNGVEVTYKPGKCMFGYSLKECGPEACPVTSSSV